MGDLVHTGSKYTDEDRRIAVAEYCVKGNLQAVSKSTGIPQTTLVDWKNSDWWPGLHNEVREETRGVILASVEQVVEKSYAVVLDRLDNGDPKLLKDANGKYVEHRVGMSGKEAALVGAINLDKRQLLLSQPTLTPTDGTKASLEALAKQFCDLADRHNVRVIEGGVVKNGD